MKVICVKKTLKIFIYDLYKHGPHADFTRLLHTHGPHKAVQGLTTSNLQLLC
jgi:hypothetical protein